MRLTRTEVSMILSSFANREHFCCPGDNPDTKRNLKNFKESVRRHIRNTVYDHAGCADDAGENQMDHWINRLAETL